MAIKAAGGERRSVELESGEGVSVRRHCSKVSWRAVIIPKVTELDEAPSASVARLRP